MESQWYYRFLRDTYGWHVAAQFLVLFLVRSPAGRWFVQECTVQGVYAGAEAGVLVNGHGGRTEAAKRA